MEHEPILDLEIDRKVEQFAESIMASIRDHDPEMQITSTADQAISHDETACSQRVYIKTKFGVVMVTPDFIKRSAAACAINIGLVRGMTMEGYTDEEIDRTGKIYSRFIEFSKNSAEVLGYYLTHKVDTNNKTK